jgi:hypothetical protein
MNKSPNCLKVILNSGDLPQVGSIYPYMFAFPALTQQNDIIYNEFFNHVRQKNLPLKILLTGCITGGLAFSGTENPFYIRLVFDGITAKNEVASSKSVEFLVQTNAILSLNNTGTQYYASSVVCQYSNLPKSNKNIGVELNDLSIFTNPITISLRANTNAICEADVEVAHANQFTVEFWLFTDE